MNFMFYIMMLISQVGLPLLGLMSTGEVAVNYLNSTNYMFLGGLIMAIAVEHCGLHNRVALKIIMMVRINLILIPAYWWPEYLFTKPLYCQ